MEKKSGNIVRVREIANERKMKLSFISERLGMSSGYLSEISNRDADVPSKHLPALAEILGTSVEYINGLVENSDEGATTSPLSVDYGKFQFQRFRDLCDKNGFTQASLYRMVGLSPKAGSNLSKTKKVKREILEIWAKELHTSAAYLNGETDDPSPAKSSFRYDRLDDLINKKHLTRKALCQASGHADNYIRMFEKRNTEPPREFVNFCAEQLGTTSAYLYGESDIPEKEKVPAAESHRVTDEDIKHALLGGRRYRRSVRRGQGLRSLCKGAGQEWTG